MPQRPKIPSAAVSTARKVRTIMWVILAAVTATVAVSYVVLSSNNPAVTAASPATNGQLVREDSHRVTSPVLEKAQLVEFVDFECEACWASRPLLEELRKEFGDRVTFVNRYFPLPGHRNSGTAALAVEAAARQGKYEQMYTKIFATQGQWGGKQESQAPVFRAFAQELGLDMDKYDEAVADSATMERVKKDVADGKAFGVKGTPTFFLNGTKLTLESEAQFRQLLAEAVQ